MKRTIFIAINIMAILLSACSDETPIDSGSRYSDENIPSKKMESLLNLTPAEKETVKIHNRFAVEYTQHLLEKNSDENVLVSPLSAICNISMMANASNGSLRSQIVDAVDCQDLGALNALNKRLIEGLDRVDMKNIKFTLANSVWLNSVADVNMTSDLANILEKSYLAKVSALPFDGSVANIINKWTSENTNGLIRNFYGSGDIYSDDVCLFVNALYFKGNFTFSFSETTIKNAAFHNIEGEKIGECKLMKRGAFYGIASTDKVSCLSIPIGKGGYGHSAYEMIIALPEKGVSLSEALGLAVDLSMAEHLVTLYMPKFKIEYETSLNETLKSMGVDVSLTDLENITSYGDPVKMSSLRVKQKTVLDVNENGVEGASATSFIGGGHGDHTPPSFIADRPFVYLIRECESKAVLFAGSYVKPESMYQ